MSDGPSLSVFFSHSHADAVWVKRVAAQAVAAGVDVYLAEHDVKPGERLSDKVTAAVERCDVTLALLSKNGSSGIQVGNPAA